VIRTGVTASAITAVSITHHADLIIMARYPHHAFLEWLTGSTADTILRNSPLPVLMI
jgi:nucleotide-binding universal stress UspA family protein